MDSIGLFDIATRSRMIWHLMEMQSLNIALKEWQIVCRGLETGRQVILLRKGGIREEAGEFVLEHPSFWLFPTYVHQESRLLKPEAQVGLVRHATEPDQVTLQGLGRVSDIVEITDRQQIDRLEHEHVWAAPLIDLRFSYRPENPLYLLIVRVFGLPVGHTIQNLPKYAGCKSWVPLDEPLGLDGAVPALQDAAFEQRRASILEALKQS